MEVTKKKLAKNLENYACSAKKHRDMGCELQNSNCKRSFYQHYISPSSNSCHVSIDPSSNLLISDFIFCMASLLCFSLSFSSEISYFILLFAFDKFLFVFSFFSSTEKVIIIFFKQDNLKEDLNVTESCLTL